MKSIYKLFTVLILILVLTSSTVLAKAPKGFSGSDDADEVVETFLEDHNPSDIDIKEIIDITSFDTNLSPEEQELMKAQKVQEEVLKIERDVEFIKEDELSYKGQKKSLTKWGKINLDEFLNYNHWKFNQEKKDQNPQWESIVRERSLQEMIGRVYQCIGRCKIDRGEAHFNGNHRTALYEGDDIETMEHAYAWIYLIDGTMLRLAPRTSVTLQEINIGKVHNFISIRLNFGNAVLLSRNGKEYLEDNHRDTESIFFPYVEYETIPEFDDEKYDENNLLDVLSESKVNEKTQKKLNFLINKNNEFTKDKKTFAFIVMPNVTIMGFSPSIEMIHLLGGKSYYNLRSEKTLQHKVDNSFGGEEIYAQLRGFENKQFHLIIEDQWFEVNEIGNAISPAKDAERFNIGSFLTKRPTRILMGREIFLERYGKFVFTDANDPLKFAQEYGYRLWSEIDDKGEDSKNDLTLRVEYLKEYFRRVETTNLRSFGIYLERLKDRKLNIELLEYGDYFYTKAMDKYYLDGESKREAYSNKEVFDDLNSKKKILWKKMHGIR